MFNHLPGAKGLALSEQAVAFQQSAPHPGHLPVEPGAPFAAGAAPMLLKLHRLPLIEHAICR